MCPLEVHILAYISHRISRAILHDEQEYADPSSFNPDRFLKDGKLNPNIRDPATVSFGYGRRICPGRFLAASSIWMVVTSVLATYDITKAIDEDGSIIEPSGASLSGILNPTLPFPCSFRPRSTNAEEVIKATAT